MAHEIIVTDHDPVDIPNKFSQKESKLSESFYLGGKIYERGDFVCGSAQPYISQRFKDHWFNFCTWLKGSYLWVWVLIVDGLIVIGLDSSFGEFVWFLALTLGTSKDNYYQDEPKYQ